LAFKGLPRAASTMMSSSWPPATEAPPSCPRPHCDACRRRPRAPRARRRQEARPRPGGICRGRRGGGGKEGPQGAGKGRRGECGRGARGGQPEKEGGREEARGAPSRAGKGMAFMRPRLSEIKAANDNSAPCHHRGRVSEAPQTHDAASCCSHMPHTRAAHTRRKSLTHHTRVTFRTHAAHTPHTSHTPHRRQPKLSTSTLPPPHSSHFLPPSSFPSSSSQPCRAHLAAGTSKQQDI
jgi:hypothetical protein